MKEMKTLNGYEIVDAKARKTIEDRTLYITPDMYGAVGDGVTDDSVAFQRCFDDSAGKTIVIPDKTYYLSTPIKLDPEIYEYTIRGLSGGRSVWGDHKTNSIRCSHHFLDGTGADGYATYYCLKISDIFVTLLWSTSYEVKNFLHNICLEHSLLYNVTVYSADSIIKGGMSGVSRIDSCIFMTVRKAFLLDGDYENPNSPHGFLDSSITNCYINGGAKAGENAVVISTKIFNAMQVTNCYIDFFKEVMSMPVVSGAGNFGGSTFSCCTFDVIWRFFTCGNDNVAYLSLDNCYFLRFNEESIRTYFSNLDAEMLIDGIYTKCGIVVTDTEDAIETTISQSRRNYIFGICFTNNRVKDVDYPFCFVNGNHNARIIEKGNTYSGYKGDLPVHFWMYPVDKEYIKTIYFEAMNDKDHTALPQISASWNDDGSVKKVGHIKCFEGMRIFYNGKPAIMHNFKWLDYAGNVLT